MHRDYPRARYIKNAWRRFELYYSVFRFFLDVTVVALDPKIADELVERISNDSCQRHSSIYSNSVRCSVDGINGRNNVNP